MCGVVLVWDIIEKWRDHAPVIDRYLPWGILLIGAYLLNLCDSKTSIFCLIIGTVVLLSPRIPFLRSRIGALGGYVLAVTAGFYLLDWFFGIKEEIVEGMGRDMTFTGRTKVWQVLFALNTDPILGTGFCSFWSDPTYQSQLPKWVASSAHNGYIETYIDGGWIGVVFLVILLGVTGIRLNAELEAGGHYALFRFATFLAIVIGSFAESHFGRMGPLWFLFLLAALDPYSLPRPVLNDGVPEDSPASGRGQPSWCPS